MPLAVRGHGDDPPSCYRCYQRRIWSYRLRWIREENIAPEGEGCDGVVRSGQSGAADKAGVSMGLHRDLLH